MYVSLMYLLLLLIQAPPGLSSLQTGSPCLSFQWETIEEVLGCLSSKEHLWIMQSWAILSRCQSSFFRDFFF